MPVIRASNGMGRILGQSAAAVSHTGDTTLTTLATITIPAGAMGANGRIEIAADISTLGTGGTHTQKINFGGSQIWTNAPSTVVTVRHSSTVSNRNSASSQRYNAHHISSAGASVTLTTGTLTIDTTASVDITITGQLASAGDTITLESYQVILYPKA